MLSQAEPLTVDTWCKQLIDHAAGVNALDLPKLPPQDIQKIPSNTSGVQAMEQGAAFYRILDSQVDLEKDTKVLDYGCGWGRMSRFLLRTVYEENIFGVDVEERTVSAAQVAMPKATFKCMSPGDTLPFDDQSIDIAFSNSVFSHLSESAHRHYMSEIARCLKPSGKLLASFLEEAHLNRWVSRNDPWLEDIIGPGENALDEMKRSGFVYGHSRRIQDYGMAFIAEDWIIKNLPEHLSFCRFVGGYAHSLILAEKA